MAHSTTGTDAKGLIARMRADQCLQLRLGGADYKQIGKVMKFTPQRAHQIITRELKKLNEKLAESATDVTQLEMARLDTLWMHAMKAVSAGDVAGINAALRVMGRRATLLGLDAPARTIHTGEGGGAIELELTKNVNFENLTEEQVKELGSTLRTIIESPSVSD